ncbi:MAG: hypothetical protein ACRC7I_05710 [Selenomonadaceae bacterium]
MKDYFYVASCVFTEEEPALSEKIQQYVQARFAMPVIRCCTPQYKVNEFEQRMPQWYRAQWQAIPHFKEYPKGSMMVSICHNCSAVFEEQYPEIERLSLWELILQDDTFSYPDYHGMKMTVQDCWRSKENQVEQHAVRELMQRMHIECIELDENGEQTKFCGYSLYQPQPARNPKLAPKRFLAGAKGLFQEHTSEEKQQKMKEYCLAIPTEKVVAYCHYCVRGLNLGGKQGIHLARLLFEPELI